MAIEYQKLIDDAVYQKLNKLTINEIRIVINQFQLQYKKPYSNQFYHAFVTNVRNNNDTQIRELYINQLNQNFNHEQTEKIEQLAQRYQINPMKQLIRKQVNQTFDEQFKSDFQRLIKQIGQSTMQTVPF